MVTGVAGGYRVTTRTLSRSKVCVTPVGVAPEFVDVSVGEDDSTRLDLVGCSRDLHWQNAPGKKRVDGRVGKGVADEGNAGAGGTPVGDDEGGSHGKLVSGLRRALGGQVGEWHGLVRVRLCSRPGPRAQANPHLVSAGSKRAVAAVALVQFSGSCSVRRPVTRLFSSCRVWRGQGSHPTRGCTCRADRFCGQAGRQPVPSHGTFQPLRGCPLPAFWVAASGGLGEAGRASAMSGRGTGEPVDSVR